HLHQGTPRDLATRGSALACLIAWIGFVDNKDTPLAAHDAAVLVAFLQRLQRIDDLHAHVPRERRNIGRGGDEVKSWARIECVPCVQARERGLRYCRSNVAVAAAQLGDVVAAREEGSDVARRLAQALSVLNQGDAYEAFAMFAKGDPRRHRDIGLLEQ